MSEARHPREELKAIIAEDKPAYVRSLFNTIARDYDRMNWVMTGGLLALWHRAFVRETQLKLGDAALDVCCGTGDLALLMARRVGPNGSVAGVDFSPSMLKVAHQRAGERLAREESHRMDGPAGRSAIEWLQQDALELEFPDGGEHEGFHCVSMGFALRNVGDLQRSLSEMTRVCRTGGRVVCLEVSRPDNPLIHLGFRLYFFRLVPLLGRLGERSLPESSPLKRLRPYTYLPYSLEHLPPSAAILDMMRSVGLVQARRVALTGGAVSLYIGVKG